MEILHLRWTVNPNQAHNLLDSYPNQPIFSKSNAYPTHPTINMPEQHKDIMQSRFPFYCSEPCANAYTETKESVHSGTQKAKEMFKHKDKEYVTSTALHTKLRGLTRTQPAGS